MVVEIDHGRFKLSPSKIFLSPVKLYENNINGNIVIQRNALFTLCYYPSQNDNLIRNMVFKKSSLNSILQGDCINIMKKLPPNSFQLILTDPPYNISGKSKLDLPNNTTGGPWYKMDENWDVFKDYTEYLDFTRKWMKEATRLLDDKGTMIVCCSYHSLGEILIALKELGYKILNIIIWKKKNPMPNVTKRTLTHSTEYAVWAAKSKGWTFNYMNMKKYAEGKQLRDVWEFALCQGPERIKNESKRAAHPTQKPLEFMKRLLEMATNEHDLVLDPFVGVGTTSVAANQTKRKWIGIENNPNYVKIAKKRLREKSNNN